MSIGKIHLQWFAEPTVLDDIKNILTIEQIKAFIEANKERDDVIEYLGTLTVEKELNTETVNAYLETAEGKLLLQPRLDRYATIAIKTHDEKQAPVIDAKVKAGINEGIRKLHPEETEDQKKLRELNDSIEQMKRDGEAKELRNSILMRANELHVPKELVEAIPYPSVDHFVNAATVFDKLIAAAGQKAVNEYVAANSYKPGSGKEKDDKKIDLSKLSQAELIKMEMNGTLDSSIGD
jgi:hypothetical protein